MTKHYSVRDEYHKYGPQTLTLWSGAFASDYDGEAVAWAGGYMVTLEGGRDVRVYCETPRTDANFLEVNAAINAALNR